MYAKVCVFVFLALFALQASAKPTDLAERDMHDALAAIVDKLTNIIHTAVDESKDVLQELAKLWKELAHQFLDEGKDHLEQLVEIIRKKYQELVAQAQAIQTDVKECYTENKEAIDALNQNFQAQMQGCVAGQVEVAQKIVAEFRAAAKEAVAEVKNILEQLVSCDGSVVCYIGAGSQALDFFKSLRERFGPIVQEAAALVQSAQSEVPQCIEGVQNNITPQVVELQETISKCIQDKVNA